MKLYLPSLAASLESLVEFVFDVVLRLGEPRQPILELEDFNLGRLRVKALQLERPIAHGEPVDNQQRHVPVAVSRPLAPADELSQEKQAAGRYPRHQVFVAATEHMSQFCFFAALALAVVEEIGDVVLCCLV